MKNRQPSNRTELRPTIFGAGSGTRFELTGAGLAPPPRGSRAIRQRCSTFEASCRAAPPSRWSARARRRAGQRGSRKRLRQALARAGSPCSRAARTASTPPRIAAPSTRGADRRRSLPPVPCRPFPDENRALFERIVRAGGGYLRSSPDEQPATQRRIFRENACLAALRTSSSSSKPPFGAARATRRAGRAARSAAPRRADRALERSGAGLHCIELRRGAKLCTAPRDVLDELDRMFLTPARGPRPHLGPAETCPIQSSSCRRTRSRRRVA